MNKKEVIKHLEENEMNVQSAHAAVVALDLVYVGYIGVFLRIRKRQPNIYNYWNTFIYSYACCYVHSICLR